jgi:hypothetical protein
LPPRACYKHAYAYILAIIPTCSMAVKRTIVGLMAY